MKKVLGLIVMLVVTFTVTACKKVDLMPSKDKSDSTKVDTVNVKTDSTNTVESDSVKSK